MLTLERKANLVDYILIKLSANFLTTDLINVNIIRDDTGEVSVAFHEIFAAFYAGIDLTNLINQTHKVGSGICLVDKDETLMLRDSLREQSSNNRNIKVPRLMASELTEKPLLSVRDKRLLKNLAVDTDVQYVRSFFNKNADGLPTVTSAMRLYNLSRKDATTVCAMDSLVPIFDAIDSYHSKLSRGDEVINSFIAKDSQHHFDRFTQLVVDTAYTHYTLMRFFANKATSHQIAALTLPILISARSRIRFTCVYSSQIEKYRKQHSRTTPSRILTMNEKMAIHELYEKLKIELNSEAEAMIRVAELLNKDILQFRDILKRQRREGTK
ncbi:MULTISPECIES: hypothetical protein [Vibrio]|uniref:hypothetical protein n=1 Tax=Vibrio TaxID=662 RepID=UPI000DA6B7F4|nr:MULTISPECIES: hypothetical protein [Vibrio]HBV77418.1 hypothetical protein [Vibrio sp.]